MPGLAVTSDIIVGFPSESEEDFNLTRAALAELNVPVRSLAVIAGMDGNAITFAKNAD